MSFQRPLSRFLYEAADVAPITADTLNRYTSDASFRDALDAETAANRARANAAIDAAVRKSHPHIERGAGE